MVEEFVKRTTDGAKVYAKDLVRVDSDAQKIDKFFRVTDKQTNKINSNTKHSTKNIDIDKNTETLDNRNDLGTHEASNNIMIVDDENAEGIDRRKDKTTDLYTDVDMVDVEKETSRSSRFLFEDEEDLNYLENPITEENESNINNNKKHTKHPECSITKEHNKNNNEDDLESSLVSEPNKERNPKDNWKSVVVDNASAYVDPKESFKTRTFKCERVETKLTSVKQLRLSVENTCSSNLREILANLIFIACIDCERSLIQHSTKLYLCDTTKLT